MALYGSFDIHSPIPMMDGMTWLLASSVSIALSAHCGTVQYMHCQHYTYTLGRSISPKLEVKADILYIWTRKVHKTIPNIS